MVVFINKLFDYHLFYSAVEYTLLYNRKTKKKTKTGLI